MIGSVDDVNPTLTVIGIRDGQACVAWFDKEYNYHSEWIPTGALCEIAGYNDEQEDDKDLDKLIK